MIAYRNPLVSAFWFALGLSLATPAVAIDAGRVGPVYGIREPEFSDEIAKTVKAKVDSGEWNKLQEEARRRAPRQALPILAPSPALPRQRRAAPGCSILRWCSPHKSIPDASGRVMYPAGTGLNPLDTVSLPQPLRSSTDAIRSRSLWRLGCSNITKVPLRQSWWPAFWQKLGREWKRQVYFDQQGKMVQQLGIQAVPALVTQEDRALRIEEFTP